MGPSGLADHLTDFVFDANQESECASFRRKTEAGMTKNYLRGASVVGSMPISDIVGAVLCAWGDEEEQDHPALKDVPMGVRDAVASWVKSIRD